MKGALDFILSVEVTIELSCRSFQRGRVPDEELLGIPCPILSGFIPEPSLVEGRDLTKRSIGSVLVLGVGRVFQGLTGGPWKQELPHSRLPSWPVCLRSPHLCLGSFSLPTPSLGLPTPQTPSIPPCREPLTLNGIPFMGQPCWIP